MNTTTQIAPTMLTTSAKNRTSILARLLASENITVIHSRTAPSAAFDLKTRTLILPMWNTDSQATYDFLVGHEVGHAKYTPQAEWKSAADKIAEGRGKTARKVAQDYINVVEDARIERAIKRDFPGLRRDFIDGYKNLLDLDIFCLKGRDLHSLPLIDRLNLHFKIGIHCGVTIPFMQAETQWIDRIANARTWDEVVQIATELFERETQNQRDEESEDGEGNSGGESEEGEEREGSGEQSEGSEDGEQREGSGEQSEGSEEGEEREEREEKQRKGRPDGKQQGEDKKQQDGEDEKDGDAASSQDGDEDGEKGEDGEEGEASSNDKGTDESMEDDTDDGESAESVSGGDKDDSFVPPSASTVDSMNKGISDRFVDTGTDEHAAKVAIPLPERVTVGVDEFCKHFDSGIQWNRYASQATRTSTTPSAYAQSKVLERFKEVCEENKRAVDLMCKRFETRRAARNFAREGSMKSGRISTRHLAKYKFSEDIFDRLTIKRDEKNHGIVILLDWSGSMGGMISESIRQLVMLLQFCRRVGIPAEVYFFSSYLIPELDRRFDEITKGYDFSKSHSTKPKRTDFIRYSNYDTNHPCGWSVEGEMDYFTDWVCGLPAGTTERAEVTPLKPFSLVKVYEPNMSNRKFTEVIGRLILTGDLAYGRCHELEFKDDRFVLGDTPLDESLLAMIPIVNNFRKSSNAKITMISLSDGEGLALTCGLDRRINRMASADAASYGTRTVLIDPITGRRYMNSFNRLGGTQEVAVQMFKDNTGCSITGIYMMPNNTSIGSTSVYRRHLDNKFKTINKWDSESIKENAKIQTARGDYEAQCSKKFTDEKFIDIDFLGYSRYFIVGFPTSMDERAAEKEAQRLEKMKNQKVAATRAFIAQAKREDANRIFINRLIDILA